VRRYTVTWWQSADDELLRLWLDSSERSLITDASREIDKVLSMSADSVGEEVSEGLRALEVSPLRIQFSLEEKDRIVRVWTVRLTGQ
jgi:hypothetical protein